jgi:putative redox protein
MQNLKVTFENDAGLGLDGLLAMPADTPRAFALFARCFTCSKNLKAATHISRALTDAGIAVLRFDFTGLGQGEGEFADTNFFVQRQRMLEIADRCPVHRTLHGEVKVRTALAEY